MNTKKTQTKKRFEPSETVFALGKKLYVAKEFNPCEGCVLASFPGKCSLYARPPCDAKSRKDGKNVIFVKMDELLRRTAEKGLVLSRENRALKRTLRELKRQKSPQR